MSTWGKEWDIHANRNLCEGQMIQVDKALLSETNGPKGLNKAALLGGALGGVGWRGDEPSHVIISSLFQIHLFN